MGTTVAFVGGKEGRWVVTRTETLRGTPLPAASHVSIVMAACIPAAPAGAWVLLGCVSNLRYTTQAEACALKAVQPPLDRPTATCAALIAIRKSETWWELAQDERRAVFEETSQHTAIGLGYLPAIARCLHHCRDLEEPFDFLTWFEFAPECEADFNRLVETLRATPEWAYVECEIDIRLSRASADRGGCRR